MGRSCYTMAPSPALSPHPADNTPPSTSYYKEAFMSLISLWENQCIGKYPSVFRLPSFIMLLQEQLWLNSFMLYTLKIFNICCTVLTSSILTYYKFCPNYQEMWYLPQGILRTLDVIKVKYSIVPVPVKTPYTVLLNGIRFKLYSIVFPFTSWLTPSLECSVTGW